MFKSAEDAIEARTTAAARICFHLMAAAAYVRADLRLGWAYDGEMAKAVEWRAKWDEAQGWLDGPRHVY